MTHYRHFDVLSIVDAAFDSHFVHIFGNFDTKIQKMSKYSADFTLHSAENVIIF